MLANIQTWNFLEWVGVISGLAAIIGIPFGLYKFFSRKSEGKTNSSTITGHGNSVEQKNR